MFEYIEWITKKIKNNSHNFKKPNQFPETLDCARFLIWPQQTLCRNAYVYRNTCYKGVQEIDAKFHAQTLLAYTGKEKKN